MKEMNFLQVLRTVLSKSEIDEDTLTRVIVTRAEKDLKEIMNLFEKRTNVSLEQAIGKHTSGHYKHFLLALVANWKSFKHFWDSSDYQRAIVSAFLLSKQFDIMEYALSSFINEKVCWVFNLDLSLVQFSASELYSHGCNKDKLLYG